MSKKISTEVIDISLLISHASVVWPSASRPSLTRRLSIDRGDPVNDSDLFMNVHTGTHIDAPLHHLKEGGAAHEVPLDPLLGRAWVAELLSAPDITVESLEKAWPQEGTARLLLKTRNSKLWAGQRTDFTPDYCALTEDSARWLVKRGVRLVGIDYLSVQRFSDPPTVHRLLFGAGVIVLEGLDLSNAQAGWYELICLPLKLAGSDGSPARAVLRKYS